MNFVLARVTDAQNKRTPLCVTVGPIRAENGGSQGNDQPPTQHNVGEERVIFVNAPHQPAKYKNNHITTAKYSFLSFVPLFLFEQFRRYSNCFFLFIALMQVIIHTEIIAQTKDLRIRSIHSAYAHGSFSVFSFFKRFPFNRAIFKFRS